MADPTAEARIRDLERRLDLDSGSRLFVSLAEEYRKVGRFKDALSALQKGLLAHPGYIAAQVALGRVYVEANQATDAIATFTKVLAADPANLVAAKSLADIHMGRRDNLEALKKYKLYRAISGDRKVDAIIAELEPLVAPEAAAPAAGAAAARASSAAPAVPGDRQGPPTDGAQAASARARGAPGRRVRDDLAHLRGRRGLGQGQDGRPVPVHPDARRLARPRHRGAPRWAGPSRRRRLRHRRRGSRRPGERRPAVEAAPAPPPPPEPVREPEPDPEPVRPTGRALADLYYAQGHYAEALQIYDDLVMRHPFDDELKRMRRDAEARLLPASTTPSVAAQDAGLERRLARIRALKQWLSLVQAG